jgi:hypothetical protein
VIATALGAGLVGLAGPAAAQTGDLTAFCQARVEANGAESKKETQAVLEKLATAAPPGAVSAVQAIQDGFRTEGNRFFDSEGGLEALGVLDKFVFENCPGTAVPVTAIDYEFQGMPDTLPAGPAKFSMTNSAPSEEHEMAMVPLTEAGQEQDVEKLLKLPDKKLGKFVDFSGAAFMYAPPGQTSYTLTELKPGKYVYACFIPVGGKKKGAPHFTQGMYGTFTVS